MDEWQFHIEALAKLIERRVEDDRPKIKGVVYEKIKTGEIKSFYKPSVKK